MAVTPSRWALIRLLERLDEFRGCVIAVPGSSRADTSGSDEDSEGRRIGRHRTSSDVTGPVPRGRRRLLRRPVDHRRLGPVGPPGNRSDVFQDGFGRAEQFPNVPVSCARPEGLEPQPSDP